MLDIPKQGAEQFGVCLLNLLCCPVLYLVKTYLPNLHVFLLILGDSDS